MTRVSDWRRKERRERKKKKKVVRCKTKDGFRVLEDGDDDGDKSGVVAPLAGRRQPGYSFLV